MSAVFILMFITSMGIFGFLSKAHIEQTTISGDKSLEIVSVENQIKRYETDIFRAENSLKLLDDTLARYTQLGAVTKGLNARKEQEEERNELNQSIQNSTKIIAELTKKKFDLRKEQLQIRIRGWKSNTLQNSSMGTQLNLSLRMRQMGHHHHSFCI